MYTQHGQPSIDARIRQHAPLVRRIAQQMIARLPPNVEMDELVHVGMIGLAEALSRYDAAQGVQFETFATQRIRGAMIDELRDSDWLSRSARKSQRDIEVAMQRLEQQLGRPPRESEIAQAMGIDLAEYQDLLNRVRGTQLVYLEDISPGDDDDGGFLERYTADEDSDPAALLRDQRMKRALIAAIEQLPEREQHVMAMYYEHEMNLKEIAAVLDITESRVSQIHTQAITRLRTKLRAH